MSDVASNLAYLSAVLAFAGPHGLAQTPDPLETHTFDIPSQPADAGLTQLAQQARVPILFPFDDVTGVTTNEVVGQYTLEEALERLLADTDLEAELNEFGVLTARLRLPAGEESEPASSDDERDGFWSRLTASLGLAATTDVEAEPASRAVEFGFGADLLEEIVVTARRREESLRDVPVAVSVISGDYVREAGILDQYDLLAEIPGIQYDQSRDRLGARPSIRGVSTTNQNVLFQTTSVFLDGMPLLGNVGSLRLAGVERIEVLRGPQSTAFGRATFAGAINYVSRDPGDEFSGEFKLATSRLNRNSIGVSLDGPINGTLGFTFDASFDEFQGPDEWVTSEGLRLGGTSTGYATAKLKFAPNDTFDAEIRLLALRADDEHGNEAFIAESERDRCTNISLPNGRPYVSGSFRCDPGTAFPPGGAPRNRFPERDFAPGTLGYYVAQTYSVLDPSVYTDRDRLSAEFNFALGNGNAIQILTAYQKEDSRRWDERDWSSAPAVVEFRKGVPSVRGVSSMANPMGGTEKYLDVRWLSPSEAPVRWQAGASWFDYSYRVNVYGQFAGIVLGLEDEANGGRPFQPGTRAFDRAANIGLYGGVSWDVSGRTTLSFEGRFQVDDITSINELSGSTFDNVTESFQPRLGFTRRLSDDWSLYGQLASGTNPAGVNTVFASPPIVDSLAAARAGGLITYDETTYRTFEEEKLTNLEAGLKGAALNNRLQLAAALYVMKWDGRLQRANLDWSGVDPEPATGLCTGVPNCWNDGSFDPRGTVYGASDTGSGGIVIPSEGADLRGLELEGSYFINDRWGVRGSIAISIAEYDGFCSSQPVRDFGVAPTATIAAGALFDCVDVTGNALPQESAETLSLIATYRAPLGVGDWQWAGQLNVRYQGEQYADVLNLLSYPAATQVNGSITMSRANWHIVLFGNNLAGEDTPRYIGFSPDRNIGRDGSRWNYHIQPRIPREIGGRLTYRF